jgi:hypothetical protein
VPTAVAPFTLDTFDPSPAPESFGANYGRVAITKTFTGDLAGTSVVEMISTSNDDGPLAYVALERFDVTLHGKRGTFAMQHCANNNGGAPHLDLVVVQGSGTGDLAGIRGAGSIDIAEGGAHTLTLDYEIG